jgi:hypothetical protein
MTPPAYHVTTFDLRLGRYTPQLGCPAIVRGVAGLRRAVRRLRAMGYLETSSRDRNVSVRRIFPRKEGEL